MNQNFLWSSDASQRKLHLVGWHKVTKSKRNGGLGIRQARKTNMALLAKCVIDEGVSYATDFTDQQSEFVIKKFDARKEVWQSRKLTAHISPRLSPGPLITGLSAMCGSKLRDVPELVRDSNSPPWGSEPRSSPPLPTELNRNDYISDNFLLPIIETAESVHEEVWSLKSILELDHFNESERLNAFKGDIVEAIPKFRDVLEHHINKCQSLDDESSEEWFFYEDVEKVRKEMISFLETMEKINKEYKAKDLETSNVSVLADEDFVGNAKDMVGVYDEDLQQLIHKLLTGQSLWVRSSELIIISVVGMAGIGKTTIVKTVYNEPVISDHFDFRAFLRMGPDYHLKDILLDLLVCLFPNYNKILGIEKSEDELEEQIYEFINGRRYLIVLDDVWDIDHNNDIRWFLPNDNNGSRIIVTTRLSSVASYYNKYNIYEIRFRNEEESWNLFCRKVFVPPGLEKVGKKIVKKCGGLPLGIISIASILSKAEKSLESWEKVAKNENMLALATEEGSHMSEVLFLSYEHLPPQLKECCLYFGVFPLNHEISVSKLIKLWVGEGLVVPHHFKTFEDTVREYLDDLVSRNIVLIRQRSSSGRVKTLKAHFFWHLLVREAANKKIFHLINSYPSAFSEDIHCQRKLCIHRNALLGFKRVSESIESVSNVHSFLCTGPEHQYPVSICSGLTSIKVLDALTIRLYKFPIGILDLVELKYLAFTYDGKLPSSISRLKNLVYLIVHRYHLTIINSSQSYMPIEIWNMQELRHLQVMGSDLPHPVDGAQLPNLLTLLGVSDRNCTKEVLLLPKSVFPSSLTKLTLSGCGFAWEDMSLIGRALPNLGVLKLRCYAFQGPEWVVDEMEFPKLEHLLLEDTDLVHWRVAYGCFPQLKRLIIRHCYKLEKIPCKYVHSMIELVDCNPSALAYVKHILEKQRERGNGELQIQVHSSLDDEKH
ncbi:hypothetical protein RD792_005272 [Penstemon davidsonii]|uniref:NB-ARC domain-containing protein n=1 Tax=Penstemon davidsonii TaxID=160366 RepID=A0ABR0DKX4_9LAMI|nr:hypothetical protein RD792_005272 [Penstemon davidsonii]